MPSPTADTFGALQAIVDAEYAARTGPRSDDYQAFRDALTRGLAARGILPPPFERYPGTIRRVGPHPRATRGGDRLPLAYYPLAGLAVAGTLAVAGLLFALLARLGEWLLAAIAVRLAVWQ